MPWKFCWTMLVFLFWRTVKKMLAAFWMRLVFIINRWLVLWLLFVTRKANQTFSVVEKKSSQYIQTSGTFRTKCQCFLNYQLVAESQVKNMKLWCFLNNGLPSDILRFQNVFTGTLAEHWLLSVDGGTKLLLQRGFLMLILFKCVVDSHVCSRCSVSVNMSKLQFNKKLLLSNLSFSDITLHSWCWTTKTSGFHICIRWLASPQWPQPPLSQSARTARWTSIHYDHLHISHSYNQYHDDVDEGTQVFRHEEEVGSYIEGRGNFADENAMQFRGRSSSWY